MGDIVNAKPADFFMGVMDFFAILLPGAILTFLLLPKTVDVSTWTILTPIKDSNSASWIAFFVASYVLGHLLHHMGTYLDDLVYDSSFKKYHTLDKIENERDKYEVEPRQKVLEKTYDIMERTLSDKSMFNAFQWAQGCIRAVYDSPAKEIDRGGADSKFFRSLAIAALFATYIFLYNALPDSPKSSIVLPGFQEWALSTSGIVAIKIGIAIFMVGSCYTIVFNEKIFPSEFQKFLKIMNGVFIFIFVATLVLPMFLMGPILQVIISALISTLVFYFSLWRYCDLRWKNSQLIYQHFILLSEVLPQMQKDLALRAGPESAPPNEPHKSNEVSTDELEGGPSDSLFHLIKENMLKRLR